MWRLVAVFLFVSVQIFSNNVIAGSFTVYGAGIETCGSWVEKRKDDNDRYELATWMSGCISGVGYSGVTKLEDSEANAFIVFMDNYCQAHPLDDFAAGVEALVNELAK